MFFIDTFPNQQGAILSETIHDKLLDYLENHQIENDNEREDDERKDVLFDTYETKAKTLIQNWTNKGFLTNYQNDNGEIFYELSSHSSKTIDWLTSLIEKEYISTESKFKDIFDRLKNLVEFMNEDVQNRIQLLKDKKAEIEQQIQQIEAGEAIEVFEDFQIEPRFKELNQSAKELLSDFKEVERNFIKITNSIREKHIKSEAKKSILTDTFETIEAIDKSSQGKSFYAFYNFLTSRDMQNQWESLISELYTTLEEKQINANDTFLKEMSNYLFIAGNKVIGSKNRMATKLSQIIRSNAMPKSEATKKVIQEINALLIEISKTNKRPEISLELETDKLITIPFEKQLTFEQTKEIVYSANPKLANNDLPHSEDLSHLFKQYTIDKQLLRQRIKDILETKFQATIHEVIEHYGGIEKGLPEVFGYIGVAQEFNSFVNKEKTQRIVFNKQERKSILIPEIIITK